MVVRNNLSAVNTLNTLNRNHTALAKSLQTVSSGMRINSAKDDASGYAISERMRVQIRSLNQDNQNTQNGHSMMKVAEGAVQSTVDILKTLKEKVINAANDTNTDSDRAQIQKELNQSIDQINDNANVTYNGKYLVDGSKNSKGDATYTSLTNQSLAETTTRGTLLTKLADRNGNNLGILATDTVTVSYVKNGKTFTGEQTVGAMSLTDIFALAESLDTTSATPDFADQFNNAVAKATGVSNPQDLADQVEDARDFATNALTAKTDAEKLKNKYDELDGNVNVALTNLTDAINAATNDAALRAAIGTLTMDDAATEYGQWKATSGISAESGRNYANTSNMSSYSSLNTLITNMNNPTRRATYAALDTLYSAYTAYNTAYSYLSTFIAGTATTDTSTHNSSLSGAYKPTQPQVDLIEPQGYQEHYDTSSYKKYQETASDVYDEAVSIANMGGGPRLLDDEKIGVNRAGEVVETSNREKAITVIANGSGIDGQISGFTVSVTDKDGNIKKSVNAALDAWEETIRAENKCDDNAVVLHVGTKANQAIKIGLSDMRARALGLQGEDGTTLNVSTQKNANAAINVLDNAIQKALNQQTTIGSIESRLGYTSTNLTTAIENVTASESTIRDADMALAMTEYTKNNILAQSSQAMLAQANQSNNQVLSLLR